jgi:hypothetical protein
MYKEGLLAGCFDFVMEAVLTPRAVSEELDPLASPTPQLTGWIAAPGIVGNDPVVLMSEGNQGDTHPSDIICNNVDHPGWSDRFPSEIFLEFGMLQARDP